LSTKYIATIMSRFLSIILAVVFSITCEYSFCQVSNTNISNDKLYDGEPFLAVNPTNYNNLIIAWMGFSYTSYQVTIKTENSFDGGQTWGNYNELSHISKTWHSADVSMTFRKDGAVFLSYIDYREGPDSGGIFVVQSTNGGTSWSAPVQAWSVDETPKMAIDRPWIMVDNSNTVNAGTLYMTTKPAPWIPAPNRPYLKVSTDSNKTWSAYHFIDTTGYLVGNDIQAPMASVAVSANGALCLAYPSYLISQSLYAQGFLAKSYNKGNSFSYDTIISVYEGVSDTNYKRAYRIVANPKDSNELAFAYMGINYGDPDIFVSTTQDGGKTWSSIVRVNDDPIGDGVAQDMLWENYDTSGNLIVSWRDRRNALPDTGFYAPTDFYCSLSSDNGKTFSKNVRLSSMTAEFDSVLSKPGNDFMCNALVNDSIYSAWGDTRTGVLNVFFAKASVQTGTGFPPVLVYSEKMPAIIISPNPTQNNIKAQFIMVENEKATVSITDVTGKQVLSLPEKNYPSGNNQVNLNIQNLSSGEYFFTLKTGEGNQTAKFVKE
jgi:hypothetical protein